MTWSFRTPISAGWCRSKFPWVNFASDIPQTQQQTSQSAPSRMTEQRRLGAAAMTEQVFE
jgi:hypothetical protein